MPSRHRLIVATLRVGTQLVTLCVIQQATRSVWRGRYHAERGSDQ
jgi:hypothetical protein